MIEFPISGVETYWWLPISFAFAVSLVTSMAGLSGAFLVMPFQISVLGFTAPGVTPTNLLFNVFAIPSGVYRLYKERRMVWPLVWTIAIGTVPGLIIGVIVRIRYLPDPVLFKLFVGLVLGGIALRLLFNSFKRDAGRGKERTAGAKFEVTPIAFNLREIAYEFNGEKFSVSTPMIVILSVIVGAIGGIYGIGGGAILAPFLVAVFGLPVHTIAGAALCSTLINSTMGVALYLILSPSLSASGQTATPDWYLGLMFGIGGAAGIYAGARLQKHLPAGLIKLTLALIMIYISARYVISFFE